MVNDQIVTHIAAQKLRCVDVLLLLLFNCFGAENTQPILHILHHVPYIHHADDGYNVGLAPAK